ncbi:MAG: amidohydrolase family protein, partial [Pseudomonadota bacterium]
MNLLQIISVMFALHFALAGCSGHLPQKVDVLISGGLVYTGDANNVGFEADVGIADDRIVFIGDARHDNTKAKRTIDATGMIVAPGFIDPHTHTLNDLFNQHGKLNENYLTQGVTTVLTGNDGGGPIGIRSTLAAFAQSGVGTNVGLFVGHGT